MEMERETGKREGEEERESASAHSPSDALSSKHFKSY